MVYLTVMQLESQLRNSNNFREHIAMCTHPSFKYLNETVIIELFQSLLSNDQIMRFTLAFAQYRPFTLIRFKVNGYSVHRIHTTISWFWCVDLYSMHTQIHIECWRRVLLTLSGRIWNPLKSSQHISTDAPFVSSQLKMVQVLGEWFSKCAAILYRSPIWPKKRIFVLELGFRQTIK